MARKRVVSFDDLEKRFFLAEQILVRPEDQLDRHVPRDTQLSHLRQCAGEGVDLGSEGLLGDDVCAFGTRRIRRYR
jgi:hypothetical protein